MKNNIKIMKSRKQVTDEEIHDFMDFDKLLIEKEQLIRKRKMHLIGNAGIAVLMVAIGVSLYLYNTASVQHQIETVKDNTVPAQPLPSVQSVDTVVTVPTNASTTTANKLTTITNVNDVIAKKDVVIKESETKSAAAIYIQAEPLNGYPDLYKYFDEALVYPAEAVRDSIRGDVTVIFSIDADGRPKEILIENSLGKSFDKEVFRLLEKMPLWKPASFNGKYVNSRVSLPITFELKKIHTKN